MASKENLLDLLQFRPDTSPLMFLGEVGFVWSYLGCWQQATEVFKALVSLVPQDPAGYLGLAEIALMQSRYAEAVKQGEQVVRTAIGHPASNAVDRATAARGYVIIAKGQMHQSKVDAAVEALQQAQQLDPQGASGRHAGELLQAARASGLLPQ